MKGRLDIILDGKLLSFPVGTVVKKWAELDEGHLSEEMITLAVVGYWFGVSFRNISYMMVWHLLLFLL